MNINPDLLAIAEWKLAQQRKEWDQSAEKLAADSKQAADKTAFVPPGAGGDPAAGGGAPPPGGGGDPAAGGGPPPGAGDPSMGGAPPMDPSMMAAAGGGGGGPVPGGGGMTADTISQIVAQTMQQMGMGGAGGGGAGGAGAGKMAKPDISTVAIDIFQVKKMLQFLFNSMGIPLPPDILDGPNRDPATGTPMPPGAPGSTSDPSQMSQPPGGAGGAGGGQPGGAIPPIQPMQPGGPGVGGAAAGGAPPGAGAEKQSQDRALHMGNGHPAPAFDPRTVSRAAALSEIVRRIQGR